jgi:excisionase family DNA binding protein
MASKVKSSRARGALLDIHEAAEYLGVTERWLRRQVSEKRIPYLKLGPGRSSPLRFDTAALEGWLADQEIREDV